MTTPDDLARRREADRIRKAKKRAEIREQRAADANDRVRAREVSASAPSSLASVHDIRQTLEWALAQVAADVHGSPTNRARVAGQLAREASNLVQVHDHAERLEAIEAALRLRQHQKGLRGA